MFCNVYVVHDSTATKPVTLSVSENKNPLPADTYTSSMDSLRRRSRSFDSKHINIRNCSTYVPT